MHLNQNTSAEDVTIGKLDLLYEGQSKHGMVELKKFWEGTRQKDTAKKP